MPCHAPHGSIMPLSFTHDAPAQRVVFAPGALSKVREETERLGITRVLIIATPGSGARLGARVRELLGSWAAGLHAAAAIHTPESIVQDGVRTAQELRADALVATGGGSAIGL